MIYKAGQVERFYKNPDTSVRGWIIYGANEGLIAEYVKNLTKAISPDVFDPFQVVYLNGDDVNADAGCLIGEFNAQSLMGGRRVIVIKDVDNNLTKVFKTLFDDSKSDTLVIAYSSSLNKKSSLVKLGEDSSYLGVVACYEDRDEDVFSTIRNALSSHKIAISNDALQLMAARLSNDRKSNLNEIEKLITYIGNKSQVLPDDVLAVVSDTSSSSFDDLCYAAAGGQKDKTLAAYEKLVNEGTDPAQVIRNLYYHFLKILSCLAFVEEGLNVDAAMKKLTPRIIFFREPAFRKQMSIWNRDRVFSVIDLLYQAEKNTRNANMPVEEIVSYTLMQVASAATSAAAKLNRGF